MAINGMSRRGRKFVQYSTLFKKNSSIHFHNFFCLYTLQFPQKFLYVQFNGICSHFLFCTEWKQIANFYIVKDMKMSYPWKTLI